MNRLEIIQGDITKLDVVTIHPAAAEQRAVGGVDDGVNLQRGDVSGDKVQLHGKQTSNLKNGRRRGHRCVF